MKLISILESTNVITNEQLQTSENITDEMAKLRERLIAAREEKTLIQSRREVLAERNFLMKRLSDEIEEEVNSLSYVHSTYIDQMESLSAHFQRDELLLHKFLQINSLNDAFHIWYSGPFATINDFRLGRLPTHPVDWPEINAALGEAAAAVYTVARKSGVQFKKYCIYPMGCFARLSRADDKKTLFNLFTDGSFSLFPKRNFNTALTGLLTCIDELGALVMEHDPTLQLPYPISAADGKIHSHSIALSTDEEQWTRALKYMLSDIKWIIAWSTKHLQHL
jgi:beclin